MVTVADILHNADAYRRAYPDFGRSQTVSTLESGTCWADPLSRKERRVLAGKLARACRASFFAREGSDWREMADLHLDVTERAEVPATSHEERN